MYWDWAICPEGGRVLGRRLGGEGSEILVGLNVAEVESHDVASEIEQGCSVAFWGPSLAGVRGGFDEWDAGAGDSCVEFGLE